MEPTLKTALERIREQDTLIEDQQILIDLLREDVSDRDDMIAALKADKMRMVCDRTFVAA